MYSISGNGLHVHHSLWTVDGDKDVMPDKANRLGLSKTGTNWLAGVIHHLRAIVGLTCSTPNSFKRYGVS